MSFADRLNEALAHRGWTARELCDRAVLSQPHVSDMRTGRRLPSLAVALAISQVTGWTIDSLVGEAPLGEPDLEPVDRLQPRVTTGWGTSIKALVAARGLPAIARAVAVDHSSIHAYLNGNEPRLETAIRWARALEQRLHDMALGRPRC